MKVLRDPLGRPIDRLYFKTEVLDERCEQKIAEFMDRHCGGFRLPIPTSGIIQMITAEAKLELHADLAEGVDGYTDYFTDGKPNVKISERLSSTRFENRFRFTLCHEYGHVWFHAPLWRKSKEKPTGPALPLLDLLPSHYRDRPRERLDGVAGRSDRRGAVDATVLRHGVGC